MGNDIEINNVGPIEHLTIPVPDGGGLVVLKGPNGSGKTHGIDSVASLYDKGVRSSLEKSDGATPGSISGQGVTIRLGRVNTAKGDLLECQDIGGTVDPSQLVDPGIKDPVKADAKRLASVVLLSGVKVPFSKWSGMLEGISEVDPEELSIDPVVAADKIRRKLHSVALKLETKSGKKSSQGTTLLESVADLPSEVESGEELASVFDAASAALTTATAKQEVYGESALKFEGAKSMLAELPEVDVTGLTAERDKLTKLEVDCSAKLIKASEEVQALKDELRGLEAERVAAVQKLKAASEQESSRLSISAIIDAGLPDEVTDEEIGKLALAKSEARTKIQEAEVVRRGITTRTEADAMLEKAESLASEAVRYRDLARSTDAVLEQALVDAGFDTIKVEDGRLCVESDRGTEPFSDLSHGERWRIALDLAATGLPAGAVLPVAQEAYESLDPANRLEIAEMAKQRGLVIVTALASDGELRAEVV